LSIPVIKDDILYIADFSGLFHCLNAKTGKFYWNYDLLAACWGSALLVDGHVYICDEDGDVNVFNHSADPQVAMKSLLTSDGRFISQEPVNESGDSQCNMGSSIYMTPIVANNVMYIATKSMLYAIQKMPEVDPVDADIPDATMPSN
jgi:outer membrane protein assembly factor BamB